MTTRSLLNLCPNESMITVDGKEAARLIREMFPEEKKSETAVQDIHMMLYNHTANIIHAIKVEGEMSLEEIRENFLKSITN